MKIPALGHMGLQGDRLGVPNRYATQIQKNIKKKITKLTVAMTIKEEIIVQNLTCLFLTALLKTKNREAFS